MRENTTDDLLRERKRDSEPVLDYIARYFKNNRSSDYRDRKNLTNKPKKKNLLFAKFGRHWRFIDSDDTFVAVLFFAAICCLIFAIVVASMPTVSSLAGILAIFLFVIAFWKSIVYFYRELQVIVRGNTGDEFFKTIERFNLSYYDRLIEGLSAEYSFEELKAAEITIALFFREKQASNRMFAKFTRITAIFLVIIVYAILYQFAPQSHPFEFLKQIASRAIELLFNRAREIIVLVILVAFGLNILFELFSRIFSLYEIYLLILRRSMDLAKIREREAAAMLREKMKENNRNKRANVDRVELKVISND